MTILSGIKNDIQVSMHSFSELNNLDESALVQYTNKIISIRKRLDFYKNGNPHFVFKLAHFVELSECEHLLNSFQSKLVKSFSQGILKDNRGFYQKIAEVWSETVSNSLPDPIAFGESLVRNKKKDPVIIEAMNAYLQHADIRHPSVPFFHNKISFSHFKKIQACEEMNPEIFYESIRKIAEAKLRKKIVDPDFPQKLVQQSMDHPCVIQAMNHYWIDQWLVILLYACEEGNWKACENIYDDFPEVLKKEIHEKWREVSGLERPFNFKQDLRKILHTLEECKKKMEKEIRIARYEDIVPDYYDGLFYSIASIYPTDGANPELQRNFQLAYEALSYAIRKIPFSSNFYNRENTSWTAQQFTSEELYDIGLLIKKCRDYMQQEMEELYKQKYPAFFNRVVQLSKVAEKYSLGNCGEMSSAVYHYLNKQKDLGVSIQMFHITKKLGAILSREPGGDHTFVIIGKGDSAVICDPWARKIYPAFFCNDLLEDYLGKVTLGQPHVKPFDPQNFKLTILEDDILPEEELAHVIVIEKPQLTNLIQEKTRALFAAEGAASRKTIAAEILTLLEPIVNISSPRPWQELVAGLHFFATSKLKSL